MTDCAIQAPIMREILEIVLAWMDNNNIPAYNEEHRTGLVRHIYIRTGYHTGQIMVCLVLNAPNKKKMGINEGKFTALVDNLTKIDGMTSICLNFNPENTNVILGKKTSTLWGEDAIEVRSAVSVTAFPRSHFIRLNRFRPKNCTVLPLNLRISNPARQCGICIAASEPFPFSSPKNLAAMAK